MAFTMHSHSGQFCPGHAKDQLEDIILHAIKVGYKTIGLTEHMPRTDLSDLYPEELLPSPESSLAALMPRHEAYLAEAARLQAKYSPQIHILIGFEGEWIRPAAYAPLIRSLAAHPSVDYFIGSLHHARGVPIDFDAALYARAVAACGGGDERGLFEAYFDEQFDMLRAVRPRVVGHFDLCNTSGLRKGLAEAYPKREIAEAWVRMGGRFTFSDDSHGIAQVATNYARGLDYLEGLGVREVWTLERRQPEVEGGKGELVEKAVSIDEFRASLKLEP
ncbi:histidinol phosphate phosphatase H [Parathielavia hyrcaniae]|uniref:Histidinol-phosphatase n=1 Tax=Parathielavia hyrcaniae TaxID=113614 RepID=A0AAN6Q3G9_9PEZI|nr:histidinol phosphate phosphatase H [Parathielavia hyrcaniae]